MNIEDNNTLTAKFPDPSPELINGEVIWRSEIVTEEEKKKTCLVSIRETYAYAHVNKIKPCLMLSGVSLTDDAALPKLLDDIEIKNNAECRHTCHKQEQFGPSYRQLKCEEWSNPWNGNSHIEIILSNECNSSCIYCEPMFSSKWDNEVETSKSKLPKLLERKRLSQAQNLGVRKAGPEEMKRIIKMIHDLGADKDKTACIAITGGEPMLNIIEEDHLQIILETFYKANTQWFRRIRYDLNTSLNVSEERLREVIKYLKSYTDQYPYLDLIILPSIETLGKNFNYVRYGNDFERFQKNLNILLTETDFEIELKSGIHPIAMPHMVDFFKYMNEKAKTIRPFMITHTLVDEQLRMLNGDFNHYLNDALTYLMTHEIFLKNIHVNISVIKKMMADLEKRNPSVKVITEALELFEWFKLERGIDLADISPEFYQYLMRKSQI